MNVPVSKLFDYVTTEYTKGNIRQAFQAIITSPAVEYDYYQEGGLFLRYFIHFADASVFQTLSERIDTAEALLDALSSDPGAKIKYESFIYFLNNELLIQNPVFMEYLGILIATSDPQYQSPISEKFILQRGWATFKNVKPKYVKIISSEHLISTPLQAFSYPQSLFHPTIPKCESGVPVIFLEPIDHFDYVSYLTSYCKGKSVFIFETVSSLIQLCQFKEVISFLSDPKATIYILSIYPNKQLVIQDLPQEDFYPITMIPNDLLIDELPLILKVLKLCFNQTQEELSKDTPTGNWLYHVAKNYLLNKDIKKYGKSRCLALKTATDLTNWFDPHKGSPPPQAYLGRPPHNYINDKIQEFSLKRNPRPFKYEKKIRLAHVTSQLIDGGHAPTNLLRTLLSHADRNKFDLSLIVTERIAPHPKEYPSPKQLSSSSLNRAPKTIQLVRQLGIHIDILNPNQTYEEIVYDAANILKHQNIDIVVFHGPDPINNLCGCMTNVPVRVLFEHGQPPIEPCYDVAILSSEEAYKLHQASFEKMGIKGYHLMFSINVTENWEKAPYTKESLKFPKDSFIMTTISNHLNDRLSADMCQAIGTILQRCPKAYYAPIGEKPNNARIRSLFAPYGVNDRIVFMGLQYRPSQIARSMELYLNEFPFGSGLGMLDAMAAGCPVVSMYDANGPAQARYGGVYFGLDRIIKTNKVEDYIELACRLYHDPAFYKEWSEHAKEQYQKRIDVTAYVKEFERILLEQVKDA